MEKAIKKYSVIFVLPVFVSFIIGFILPFLIGIYLSFCEFTTITDAQFVGIKNYVDVFADSTFRYSFIFTTAFAIVSVVVINVLAFIVALFLTKGIQGTNFFRTIFFMPNLIGGIVLGYVWQLLFNGVLAFYDRTITYSAEYGFVGLIILVAWQQIGYMMIIYIAGLQNIPKDVIEASDIDGANSMQRLFKVKIPMLMPSITICTFLSVTNAFKLFDQNLSLTAGEPAKLTEMLALNIYNTFYSRVGYEGVGQAKAVIFFVLVAVLAILQLKATHTREEQA